MQEAGPWADLLNFPVERFSTRRYATKLALSTLRNAEISKFEDYMIEGLVYQLDAYLATEPLGEIKHPLGWWQAFKERFFPVWLLKHWPVAYKTYNIKLLYPEINTRSQQGFKFREHVEVAVTQPLRPIRDYMREVDDYMSYEQPLLGEN